MGLCVALSGTRGLVCCTKVFVTQELVCYMKVSALHNGSCVTWGPFKHEGSCVRVGGVCYTRVRVLQEGPCGTLGYEYFLMGCVYSYVPCRRIGSPNTFNIRIHLCSLRVAILVLGNL